MTAIYSDGELAMFAKTKVLVAYASKMGGTAGIAEAVGQTLRRCGHEVDVVEASAVDDLSEYTAVIVGSAIYAGRWRPEAVGVLRKLAGDLRARRVWLFHSGPVGPDKDTPQSPPANVVRWAGLLGADAPMTFAGRLERQTARGLLARWMARTTLGGDFRDWAEIERWALQIHETLQPVSLDRAEGRTGATAWRGDGLETLTYVGYDPADERRREDICTIGNGYFGTRGTWAGSTASASHHPGTYLAGYDNRLDGEVGGEVGGEAAGKLANLPDWLHLAFAIDDGDWLTPDTAEVLDHSQCLDLRRSVLTRRFRLRDADGRITGGVERRFASMADQHLAGQELTVTPENWSGRMRIRSGIDASNRSDDLPLDPVVPSTHDDGVTMVVAQTGRSRLRVAVATRTDVTHNGLPWHDGWAPLTQPLAAFQETTVLVAQGDQVQARKTVALHGCRDREVTDPGQAALGNLTATFDDLFRLHLAAWLQIWAHFTAGENAPAPQPNLHLDLFHRLQSVTPGATRPGV